MLSYNKGLHEALEMAMTQIAFFFLNKHSSFIRMKKREPSPTNTEYCLSVYIKSKTTVENCIPEKQKVTSLQTNITGDFNKR